MALALQQEHPPPNLLSLNALLFVPDLRKKHQLILYHPHTSETPAPQPVPNRIVTILDLPTGRNRRNCSITCPARYARGMRRSLRSLPRPLARTARLRDKAASPKFWLAVRRLRLLPSIQNLVSAAFDDKEYIFCEAKNIRRKRDTWRADNVPFP